MLVLLAMLPPLIVILLLGFVFYRTMRVDAAFAPLLSVGTIIFCLLGFGSLNLLWLGRLLLYIAIAGPGLWYCIRYSGDLKGYLLSPGVLAFIIGTLALTALYVGKGYFYYAWDDYSHWGPFFKSVFQTDQLHIFTGREMVHQSYPQGTTVFYYFYSLFAGCFKEAHTFAAMGTLLVACSACLTAGASWKQPVATALRMACVPLFFLLFPYADSYITVYHDTALGAVFGAALLMILYLNPKSKRHTLAIMVGIALVSQVKEVGLLLGLGCVALYVAKLLLAGSGTFGKTIKSNLNRRTLLHTLAVLASATVPTLLWKGVLALTGFTADQFSDPLSHGFLGRVSAALRGQDHLVTNIWERFTINFRTIPVVYNGYGTPLFVTAALTLFATIFGIWLWRRKKERSDAVMLWLMPFFFAAYLFSLFYTYVCMMNEREGLLNMSYERYVSSFFIGWCMLVLGAVFYFGFGFIRRQPSLLPVLAAGAVVTLLLNSLVRHDPLDLALQPEDAGRPSLDHVSGQMRGALQPEERVWLIAQGDDGMYRCLFHYQLLPAEVSTTMPYTLGHEGSAAGFTHEELLAEAEANNISALLVYIPDDVFTERYGELFDDGLASVLESDLPSLYRIDPDSKVPFRLAVATSLP